MGVEVIVALIGLCGSILGSVIGILASSKLMAYRIEQLEKKVDKHNNLIERTYSLEESQLVTNERIKGLIDRISTLEDK